MGIIEILLTGFSVALDAFAVSICKGLSMKKIDWKKAVIIGLYFGIFQALMPVLGYFLCTIFQDVINSIDHWIAFILLLLIGLNMIRESFKKEDSSNYNDSVNFKSMIFLAIATSIDALAIGITFSIVDVNMPIAISLIGIITFAMSLLGVKIGNKFGNKFENRAQLIGGLILICIGLKILLEHLNIL